ncbi:MAG: vitamin B12 dependent methionine synthase [Bacillota bacterium]
MDIAVVNIPCEIDREQLLQKLHIKPNSPFMEKVDKMITQALEVGKPKIAYKLSYIEEKGDDYVLVDGIKFSSRVLRVNLEETFKVVPFVVTCGRELEEWAKTFTDMFDTFCADGIMEGVLRAARNRIFPEIDQEFNLGHTSNMYPGSLSDWPIKEQKPLFELLGDVQSLIGVELLPSFLMSPIKTVSGFHFPKEGSFESCQLCPRQDCPGRKAPYDKNLYAEKYEQK